MKYAIFDMDDTLCTLEHRRDKAMQSGKMNYKMLFNPQLVEYDKPNGHVVELAEILNMFNTKIIVMTARPYYMEQATKDWLKNHRIPYFKLITKEKHKIYQKSNLWKESKLQELLQDISIEQIVLSIDDNKDNQAMFESYGIPVFDPLLQ
jgi:FMN phosphatase YigB (HAD superfamily)